MGGYDGDGGDDEGYGDDKQDNEGGYGDDKQDEGGYVGRAGRGGYGEKRRTKKKKKHRKKKCGRKNGRRERSNRKRRTQACNPAAGPYCGYDKCPPKERKCRPRSCSVSSCSSSSSSDSDSSSCWSECSSSSARKQIFCESRTIGQLYSERISCLKLKEQKFKKKLRVIKSQLKVQYRQRYEFFQELRGFTQCQVKQMEEYDCTSSDDSSSSDEDCEPQCKPKCNPKRKPKCNRKRRDACPFDGPPKPVGLYC